MKCRTREGKSREFLLRYYAAFLISVGVEFRPNREALRRGGVTDEFHDDFPALQRHRPPVGSDMAEHAVFNLVPFARPRGIVRDPYPEPCLIGELLQLELEKAAAAGIAPTAIGCEVEQLDFGYPAVLRSSTSGGSFAQRTPPFVVDTYRDKTLVLRDVVDALGNSFAELFVEEVMDLHLTGVPLGAHSCILVVPDKFFLLRIDGDDRIAALLDRACRLMDVQELRVAVRM